MASHAVGLSASLLVSAGGVFRPARSMVKREKPGDLPVQQTVKFELVVNLCDPLIVRGDLDGSDRRN